MAVKIRCIRENTGAIRTTACLGVGFALAFQAGTVAAAESRQRPVPPEPAVSYADLADLADSAPLVLRAQVRRVRVIEGVRLAEPKPGTGRFFIEAKTRALIAGPGFAAADLRYIAALPVNAKGKPPKLSKAEVFLFARSVPGRPGEIQLVAPDAQVIWGPRAETSLRAILTELAAAEQPPVVTGVREAIHVPGNLAGEGETQLFLSTRNDSAASITVTHVPGRPPAWSWSFSEVAGAGTQPPPRETLAWYRLACFLPAELPRGAQLSERPQDRDQAQADYRLVLEQLGACTRLRR